MEKDFSLTVDKENTLLAFLFIKLEGRSKTSIREILKSGRVTINDRGTTQFNQKIVPGDVVKILPRPKKQQGAIKTDNLTILYEDNHIIVINKKEGLLSVGTAGDKENTAYHILNQYVKQQGYGRHIYVIHRLDRKTSGVMMFAKTSQARDVLRQNWHDIVVERSYYAVAEGKVEKQSGEIMSWLTEDKMLKIHSSPIDNGGVKAITNYKVIQQNDNYSLLKLNLETGRKNQIRVHLQSIGHSVAGDLKYDAQTNPAKRVCLHAATLTFNHPITKKELKFEVPVPNVFFKLTANSNQKNVKNA